MRTEHDGSIWFTDPTYSIDSDYESDRAASEIGALHVAGTGRAHVPGGSAHIRVLDVSEDGALMGGAVFAGCTAGLFDGFRIDEAERLRTSAFGVHCYAPDRTLVGKVNVPELVANACFGRPKCNVLYICATTSLYAVRLFVSGHETF